MNKIITRTILVLGAAAMLASCGGKAKKAAQAAAEQARLDSLQAVADSIRQAKLDSLEEIERKKIADAMEIISNLPEEPVFDINTTLGTIKVKLYKKTPQHRANFAKLALTGYYDSLLFHRVINGFMIQGGDPNTKDTTLVKEYGKGGPGYTVPAEFVPDYTHKKGALAAARRGDAANPKKESSGSQFYIVQDEKTCAQLDGDYTVFGETVEGLPVIDKIAKVATDKYDRPYEDVRIISIKLDPASAPNAMKKIAENTEK